MARRPKDPFSEAEALFAKKPPRLPEPPAAPPAIPGVREQVTLRIDSDVLAHFQEGGPGWQDRINAALRSIIADKT